jgi:hypothetical protein
MKSIFGKGKTAQPGVGGSGAEAKAFEKHPQNQ